MEYMLPSGGIVSDPAEGLELMLPSGGAWNQEEAAPPGGDTTSMLTLLGVG